MKKDIRNKLEKSVSRRVFLKAAGALGVGAVAGAALQSKFDVIGLGGGLKKVSQTRVAMGTWVTVTAVHESRDMAEQAIGKTYEEMDRSIAVFSRFDSASPVSVLNRDGVVSGAPDELAGILQLTPYFTRATRGAFDVTVKPVVDLLKRTAGNGVPPREDQIDDALSRVDASGVEVSGDVIRFRRPGMGVTLDGVAKGYIVDNMSKQLSEHGISNHLVNAGGDIRTSGVSRSGNPWRIAVEDPEKGRNYPDMIDQTDGAVATSGNYEVYYDREKVFHHVVDPGTGLCPQQVASATVRARYAMVADILSTALFVLDPKDGPALITSLRGAYNAEALILDAGGNRLKTAGWKSA
jgi:thiamine biosynthesis lipoprotein